MRSLKSLMRTIDENAPFHQRAKNSTGEDKPIVVDVPFFNYGVGPEVLYHAHESDAGYDVRNPTGKDITIKPHETVRIPLHFGLLLPPHTALLLTTRSGHAARGLMVATVPIDAGYTGEIQAVVTNLGTENFVVADQERFGQFMIVPVFNTLKFDPNSPELDVSTAKQMFDTKMDYHFKNGDQDGQFLIVPVYDKLNFVESDVNDFHTDRGATGFNASGTV